MKDNTQIIGQVVTLLVGGFLTKRGLDQHDIESLIGAAITLVGIVWKFWHWHTTPDNSNTPTAGNLANTLKSWAVVGALFFFVHPGMAQSTTNTQTASMAAPPAILGTNSQSDLGLIARGVLGLGRQVIDAMPTNLTVAPYGTYVLQPKKFGYGVGIAYNLSLNDTFSGGPIVLLDHVDTYMAFSGGVTLQADLHPLAWFGVQNSTFSVTPFGITAIGTPLSGAGVSNGGVQTINSVGADIKFGHLWGGRYVIGGAYGTRTGAGAYNGGYINGFAGWQRKGIRIGVTLNQQ